MEYKYLHIMFRNPS